MFWIGIPRDELIKNSTLDNVLNINLSKNYIRYEVKDYFRKNKCYSYRQLKSSLYHFVYLKRYNTQSLVNNNIIKLKWNCMMINILFILLYRSLVMWI